MIPELDPEDFVGFLSAMWEERGWETSVRERSDETYFVTGKRPDGKRGVIYTFPTATATVTERHLRKFVSFCKQKGIDVAVVATQGAFAEGAERVASERSVHLLDRSTLADTVEEGGLEDVLARFTEGDGDGGGAVLDRLRGVGVPIPASVGGRLPSPAVLGAVVYGLLPVGGGNVATHTGSGGSAAADQPAPSSSSHDGLGIVAGVREYATQPVPAALLAVALLVAFVLGAAVGPAVGLGGVVPFGGGGGGDAGPEVSAVSTAGGANATADVRWNARATDSLSVNGTTYDAPEGQTFLLVRMNVTNGGDEPMQFEQSALAADVAGTRYGYQPLDGTTGFPSAGLFAPGESREVWTVFAVPDEAGSATIVLDGEAKVRFVRDDSVTPEATAADA